jgi:hypothetical protein
MQEKSDSLWNREKLASKPFGQQNRAASRKMADIELDRLPFAVQNYTFDLTKVLCRQRGT